MIFFVRYSHLFKVLVSETGASSQTQCFLQMMQYKYFTFLPYLDKKVM